MAKKSSPFEQEPAVRKSFLVIGGVAVAAMLIGFILMTFVFGGGGGGGDDVTAPSPAAQTSTGGTTGGTSGGTSGGTASAPEATPIPSEPPGLQDGGRNPFAARS